MDLNVSVVVPAAGCGERMNTTTPKQFCKIRGKTIISYTIEAFMSIPWLQNIVVTTSPDGQQTLSSLYKDEDRVKVTCGSSTRHRSILNGIKALRQIQSDCDIVVIHDGVRPLIKEDLLKNIVMAAYNHGAAGVVRPLVSTVVGVDEDGFLVEALPRADYRASEMPQAFRWQVLYTAYEQCSDYDLDYGTECLHLAQKYARSKVKLLEGPDYLWKLTYRKDLYAFEGILKEHDDLTISLLGFEEMPSLYSFLCQSFSDNNMKCREEVSSGATTTIIAVSPEDQPSLWLSKYSLLPSDASLHSIIYLLSIRSREAYGELHESFNSLIKRLASDAEKTVYGVVTIQPVKSVKLVKILHHLIQETSSVLSGQIFDIF